MLSFVDIILNSNVKIMTVKFSKKDGTLQVMNSRLGVTKQLKGGRSTVNPEKLSTVYDLKSEGYRAIDKESILDVKGV